MTDGVRWFRRKVMPSRSLASYVMRLYLSRFLLILAILVTILQSLDLLNRSDNITDVTGTTDALFQYVQWRFPQIISQFIPFAALLAALFSFYSLANNSEVVIMRAAGLAPGQVVAPMVVGSLIIAGVHFGLHDILTVPSGAKLKYWEESGYTATLETASDGRSNLWLVDDRQVLEAATARRVGTDQAILNNVYIYVRGDNGLTAESMAADFAHYNGGVWSLHNVRRFDLTAHTLTRTELLPWTFNLPIEQIFARTERPDLVQIGALSEAIKTLKAAGAETFTLETSWHHRLAMALSSAMMPLMAVFVGFGMPRGGGRIGRVVIGMAVGFSYFVFDNYLVAMGQMGVVPPQMAAYGPLALFFLAGLSFLIRQD